MSSKRLYETALLSPRLYTIVSSFLAFLHNNEEEEEEEDEDMSVDGDIASSDIAYDGSTSSSAADILVAEAGDTVQPPSGKCSSELQCATFSTTHSLSTHFYVPGAPANFALLPAEIGLTIVEELCFTDRVHLADASVHAAVLVADTLQRDAVRILSKFRLDFSHVRLLLTATGCVISGSAMTALVTRSFEPADLDFFTGSGQGAAVVAFIALAGPYKLSDDSTPYKGAPGVGRVWTMEAGKTLKINVVESLTSNPLDSVTTFHLTCVYGAWMADGAWHGYAGLTEAGIAVTTPTRLPTCIGLPRQKAVWKILQKYVNRGFSIGLNELPLPHTCGVDWNCPGTIRTTNDAGCTYSPFPPWAYTGEAVAIPPTSWAMGGSGCSQGVLSQGGLIITSSNDIESSWSISF
jgi:hypothetical protein